MLQDCSIVVSTPTSLLPTILYMGNKIIDGTIFLPPILPTPWAFSYISGIQSLILRLDLPNCSHSTPSVTKKTSCRIHRERIPCLPIRNRHVFVSNRARRNKHHIAATELDYELWLMKDDVAARTMIKWSKAYRMWTHVHSKGAEWRVRKHGAKCTVDRK